MSIVQGVRGDSGDNSHNPIARGFASAKLTEYIGATLPAVHSHRKSERIMSVPLDAKEFVQLVTRVGLVEDYVAKECLYELDDPRGTADAMAKLFERKGFTTPLQSSKLLKGDTDGYILGGYRLLYKISSGSFGRVYRGDDPRTGQIVAIKILRKRWTDDPRRVELFEREGRLGLTLQHPNIVQILAVNKDNITGQYYIVMEFIEGGNLRDIISIRKKLDVDESLRVIEECASGLAYAQSRGLTHRDIKPTNILIGTNKVARLVDFGLAEISQAGAAAMFSDRAPGKEKDDAEVDRTVDYAGLEKLTSCKKGDARTDIYFLGTVLFEILTGQSILPKTRDKLAMQMRLRYELDEPIRRLGQEFGLHSSVVGLVLKMCAFEPASRYQSPALMLEGIKSVRAEIAGGKVTSRQVSGPSTIFVIEDHLKLQDVFRKRFKKMGLRVLMSIDPSQALSRYRQQPFHALIIDAGTVGQAGLEAFDQVLREADLQHLDMTAVLILNEEQANWKATIRIRRGGVVLVRPVKMKDLAGAIGKGLGLDTGDAPEDDAG